MAAVTEVYQGRGINSYAEKSAELEPVRNIAFQLLHATELGAMAAAAAAGFGDNRLSDGMAVDAMRTYLNSLPLQGRIVIGEGERDEAPMLFIGEELGRGTGPELHIAVDPLENTNAAARFGPRATSVLAASEPGGLFHAPDMYMNKLIVGPWARGVVDITAPVGQNLEHLARALDRKVSDLVIVVLKRPRNEQLIQDIRATGARVQLIEDGDLIPGVVVCMQGSSIHAVMGIGAAPEGVLSAAGLRILGGEMQARFWPKDDVQKERLLAMGGDLDKIYTERDLASGRTMIFSATAVTDGDLFRGVRFFGGGARTHSLLIYSNGEIGEVSFVDKTHIFDPSTVEFRVS